MSSEKDHTPYFLLTVQLAGIALFPLLARVLDDGSSMGMLEAYVKAGIILGLVFIPTVVFTIVSIYRCYRKSKADFYTAIGQQVSLLMIFVIFFISAWV